MLTVRLFGVLARLSRAEELKRYDRIVTTLPYPGAETIAEGTQGTSITSDERYAYRKRCQERFVKENAKGTVR